MPRQSRARQSVRVPRSHGANANIPIARPIARSTPHSAHFGIGIAAHGASGGGKLFADVAVIVDFAVEGDDQPSESQLTADHLLCGKNSYQIGTFRRAIRDFTPITLPRAFLSREAIRPPRLQVR